MQRLLVLLTASAAVSCLPDVTIDDLTIQLTCEDDVDCPDGFACKQVENEGRCIAVSVLSREPIALATGLAIETPRVGDNAAHNTLRATFALSEVPVAATVEVDGQVLSCEVSGDAPARHTCTLTVDAAVPEGQRTVSLRARDAAANVVTDSAAVVVDRRGPAVLQAAVLEALAGPLSVAPGGRVTLSVIFDEPVSAATVTVGGEACDPVTIDGARLTCGVTIVDATEGPRQAAITAVDDLDNSASTTTADLFTVDATPPPTPDVVTTGLIVYERAPWGSGESDRARFTVTAQPAAVEAGARVAVFADLAGTLLLVQGPPGILDLGGVDRARAYVAAVDAAGNRSAVVPVREQRWIASLGNKVGTRRFENPHQLFAVRDLGSVLRSPDDEEVVDVSGLDPGNAGSVSVTAGLQATLIDEATQPPDRAAPCLALDRARGEAVLFGGRASGTALNDTWLFSEGRWRQASPATSPPPRDRAGCAWDPLRDRVILVGGRTDGNANLDEIWEWDGVTWARAGVSLEDPVSGAAVAFDEARLAVVAVGGDIDRDPTDQVSLITADGVTALEGPRPPASRALTATGFDGGVVVFDPNTTQTWRLTETGFVDLDVGAPPADADDGVIAALDGELYLQGGVSGTTFRLDGDRWVNQPVAAGLGARIGVRAVGRDADILLVGGAFGQPQTAHLLRVEDNLGRFSVINGARLPGTGTVALAFDPVAGGVVAVDSAGDVFLDDGSAVLRLGRAPTGVLVDGSVSGAGALGRPLVIGDNGSVAVFDGRDFVASSVPAIVPVGANTRAVRVGDDVVLVNDAETWRLRGGTWLEVPAATPSLTTRDFALAPLGTRVVAIADDDVGILDGDTWTTSTMVGPPPRTNTALVGDPGGGRVLMFGGLDTAVSALGDLWSFDGTTFTEVPLEGPGARFGHALALDRARGQVVLSSGGGLDEVWRIDLDSGGRPALRLAVSVAASQVPVAELQAVTVNATGNVGDPLVWQLSGFAPLSTTPVSRSLLSGDEATLQLAFPSVAAGVGATATLDAVDVALTFRSN